MITSLGSGFVMNFRGVNFLSVLRMLTNKREEWVGRAQLCRKSCRLQKIQHLLGVAERY
jgi:hypothetical protein